MRSAELDDLRQRCFDLQTICNAIVGHRGERERQEHAIAERDALRKRIDADLIQRHHGPGWPR